MAAFRPTRRLRLMSAGSWPITRQASPNPHPHEDRAMVDTVAPLPVKSVSPTGDGVPGSQAPPPGGFAEVLEQVAQESPTETASARTAVAEGAKDGGKKPSGDKG